MSAELPGFKGDYLWEFDIAERQLLALAEAFPAERYGWRSAETARSVSEVLVHVAAQNFTLLGTAGIEAAPDLYGKLEGEAGPRLTAMIAKNRSLEKTITGKHRGNRTAGKVTRCRALGIYTNHRGRVGSGGGILRQAQQRPPLLPARPGSLA